MIYAVGTGRCGTKSYADQYKGLHEPEPKLNYLAINYRETGKGKDEVLNVLKERMNLNTNAISDNKQSLVIDLISEVDPDAKFVWLLREPVACICSFLRRGKWGLIRRWEPKIKGFHLLSDHDKIAYYWLEKNKLIERLLKGKRFTVIEPKSLFIKSNYGSSNPVEISEWLKSELYLNKISKQWEDWKEKYFDTSRTSN